MKKLAEVAKQGDVKAGTAILDLIMRWLTQDSGDKADEIFGRIDAIQRENVQKTIAKHQSSNGASN
jgi:hypothetical protein